jgi:CubicO group peptidase (beta-lactamase class C family)
MDLSSYIQEMNRRKLGVEGIIVLQHGKKIAEHRWIPEAPRSVYSISKSFTSIAVGMTIDDGKLSIQDKAADVLSGIIAKLPAAPPERLKKLTLEHLLTMRRGSKEFSRPMSAAEALVHPLDLEPGTFFNYDNGCTFLASVMVTAVTGLKVRDLLLDRLFRPLGIPDPYWKESDDGYSLGATGLEVTTSDLAKFGQFLLQRGNWQGKQLVSAAWIDEASRVQTSTTDTEDTDDWNLGYGYYFWNSRHGAFRGDGINGQYAIVIRDKDAVVAINSEEKRMRAILYAVWDHILPRL